MTMSDPLAMALSLVAGIGLGTIFFSGLWWTVRKAITFPHPAHLFFGSLMLRSHRILLDRKRRLETTDRLPHWIYHLSVSSHMGCRDD